MENSFLKREKDLKEKVKIIEEKLEETEKQPRITQYYEREKEKRSLY